MATNGFQAPQALQDGTRHQTGVLTHRLLRTVLENTASPAPCCLMSILPTPPLGPAIRVKPHGTEHLSQVMKSTAPQHSKGQHKDTPEGMLPCQQHPSLSTVMRGWLTVVTMSDGSISGLSASHCPNPPTKGERWVQREGTPSL